MKRILLHAVLPLFLFWGLQFSASATHIMGAELTYSWVSDNTYIFTYTFYRDCSGIAANNEQDLVCASQSCGYTFFETLPLVNGPENITPVCSAYINQTTCDGGTFFGFEKYTYQKQITLPGACSDWVFGITFCCRNTAITNLFWPENYRLWVEVRLDNVSTPFNNSPQFTNPPASVIMVNQTYHISNGAYDPDHDSLVISLAQPADSSNAPIPYIFPFTQDNPINSDPPLTFDNLTGELTVTPAALQVAVISYLVREYRNGILIGSVTRDVELIVMSGMNEIPTLTGIDSTNNFVAITCPGDSLSFSFFSSDTDSGQVLTLTWDSTIANANFSSTVDSHPVGSFSWIPDSSDVSAKPNVFTVTVKDDACPYNGVQNYSFVVYVNQCNTDNVWPGDADADYTANVYDILPIGLLFNETGVMRPFASLDWIAQPCIDWQQSEPSGVNAKHADCDGNGVIDAVDFEAITLNYGLTHNKPANQLPDPKPLAAPALSLQFSASSVPSNASISVPVMLGDAQQNATDVYGLVFTLNFDPSLIVPGSMSFDTDNSWLGNASSLAFIAHDQNDNGSFDVGLVRLDHNNSSGLGLIGTLHFTTANVVSDQELTFSFSGVVMIDNGNNDKEVSATSSSVIIESPDGVNELFNNNSITIFPNPANDFITISSARDFRDATFCIQNLLGDEVWNRKITLNSNQVITLDISSLPKGSYFFILKSEKGIVKAKLIRQ